MVEKETLMSLGLSDAEATIYLTLLELGSTTAWPIIKKTGLHRATTYQILQRLIEKGLVNYVINGNNRYFSASDPAKFLDLIKEREHALRKIIPNLELKRRMSGSEQTAHIYEGNEGLKTVFDDMLRALGKGDEYLVFGAQDVPEFWFGYFERFNRKLIANGVKRRILIYELAAKTVVHCKTLDYEIRLLPKELCAPVAVNIYKNTTVMILWNKKPSAFVVESEEFTRSFKNYFEMLWRTAVQVNGSG